MFFLVQLSAIIRSIWALRHVFSYFFLICLYIWNKLMYIIWVMWEMKIDVRMIWMIYRIIVQLVLVWLWTVHWKNLSVYLNSAVSPQQKDFLWNCKLQYIITHYEGNTLSLENTMQKLGYGCQNIKKLEYQIYENNRPRPTCVVFLM